MALRQFHPEIFIIEPLAVKKSLVFRDGSPDYVGNIGFVRIQDI